MNQHKLFLLIGINSELLWQGMVFISIVIFLFLIRRYYLQRQKHQPLQAKEINEKVSPSDWEQEMRTMAKHQTHVRWMKYNFVVSRSNQKAYRQLNVIRHTIEQTPASIIALIPSAQWLFDNFHIIYREIKKVKTTGTSYLELPIIEKGKHTDYPRIYVIARKMVAMTDGHLSEETISTLMQAYQQEVVLKSRELQVLPEMIGLCLLERVVEVAQHIINNIQIKVKAHQFMLRKVQEEAGQIDISGLLTPLSYPYPDDISFHSHVLYELKNKAVDEGAIQQYIQYHFPQNLNIVNPSEIFILEGRLEVSLEAQIRMLILSLMMMAKLDGETLFEELSTIEQILKEDPDQVYAKMDADSRGLYRQQVEKIAFRYKIEEASVALTVVSLAKEGQNDLYHPHHVGSYLIDQGRPLLIATLLKKPLPKIQPNKQKNKRKYWLYFGSLSVLVIGINIGIVLGMMQGLGQPLWPLTIVLLLVLFPYSFEIAIMVTQAITTRILPVHRIPAMDYRQHVPSHARSFVVMPVIVQNKEQGLAYLQQLHARYLANPQANIHYALLVDYADSSFIDLAIDEDIKHALIKHLNILNENHPSRYRLFSLFIRKRQWNEQEQRYMAWERKRGKLEEFFALLNEVSVEETTFSTILCDRELFSLCRYVISLDADSNLTKDNAAYLIGSIDHPLNRAIIDSTTNQLVAGYAIIQPSVKNHIVGKTQPRFAHIFSGQTGLANYPMVTSDVYQDVFQEGSFVGKGIYNAHAVFQLLHKKIPENRVLSHDLLESCYAKTAFASTIDIVEHFPSNYLAYSKREHRWIRGDWQLLPWIFKSELGGLSRWKMLDNLRASLVPASLLFSFFLFFFFVPNWIGLWFLLYAIVPLFASITLLLGIVQHKMKRPKLVLLWRRLGQELSLTWRRSGYQLIFLPTRVWSGSDAILRTLYRLFISHRHLLEWNTADSVEKQITNRRLTYFKTLYPGMLVGIILGLLLLVRPVTIQLTIVLSLLAVLWVFSYLVAYRLSQPPSQHIPPEIESEDIDLLVDAARRMWRFFDTFALKETNYLCPDNFQVGTKPKAANRTSPTNIGMQLLANLSARDFGFISLQQLLEKTEDLLYTISVLPKWNGHLYNWYDTVSLAVLPPPYISSVDSGNFVGNLIALKQGLLQQVEQPILSQANLQEINSQLRLLHIDVRLQTRYTHCYELSSDLEVVQWAVEYQPAIDQEQAQRLGALIQDLQVELDHFYQKDAELNLCLTLKQAAKAGIEEAKLRIQRIESLVEIIDHMIQETDFLQLYNRKRQLFHIGFNEHSQRLDDSYYDLIASESMITSFLAIALHQVPLKHWRRLGRPHALIQHIPTHISWSGTMFEYLMPSLLLQYAPGSVFDDSCKGAVLQQMKHAQKHRIPWGISESQHNQFDLDSNYQYKAFGVEKLRLQPSYSQAQVIAPYATMLALDYAGITAIDNLHLLKRLGAYGRYGFYEALDFSAPDTQRLTPFSVVKSFMSHHQGMSFVAINNFLHQGIMRQRFHKEPMIQATSFLLEEKLQTFFISISKKGYAVGSKQAYGWENTFSSFRHIKTITPPVVRLNYLSNNQYSLMMTSDGDGFATYQNMMLYRWRPDRIQPYGNYLYLKVLETNQVFSATYHPTKVKPDEYSVIFSHHKSEFYRRDKGLETQLMVTLSLQYDCEIRQLTIKNNETEARTIEITSYLELAAHTYLADKAHPAFNKLFIESEYLQEQGILLAKRRGEQTKNNPYLFHFLQSSSKAIQVLEFENDRLRFVGRNRGLDAPIAVCESRPFTSTTAFSNDPIFSLHTQVTLQPDDQVTLYFLTGVAASKQEAIQIRHNYSATYRLQDSVEQFRQQSLMEMKYLGISGNQLDAFQNLLSPIYYPSRYFKGPLEHVLRNVKDQSGLWRFGISGDQPILLLRVHSMEEATLVKEVVKAYEYFRINLVQVDLVILSEAPYGYMHELNDLLNHLTSSLKIYEDRRRPSFFVVHSYQMNQEELDLLLTVAVIVFTKETGIYFRQVKQTLKEIARKGEKTNGK